MGVTSATTQESARHDPIPLELANNQLKIETGSVQLKNKSTSWVSKDYDGGGPEEISLSDLNDITEELNTAQSQGQVEFFERGNTPHIRFNNANTLTYRGSSNSVNTDTVANTCNKAGSSWDTGWLSNSITLYIPSDTVDDLSDLLNIGAGTSALVSALAAGGVISSPPGWVAAAIGAVLVIIGSGISLIDNGCGVKISITVYTGIPAPLYNISAQ